MHRPLLLPLLLLTSTGPAWCGPAPAAPPPTPIQAPGDTYDFGTRSALDTSPITHTFVLMAGAKAAVAVDRLQPSCHCTEAEPVGGMDGYGRFTVAAGRTANVVVTVNPNDMAPGPVEKEVFVFVNGHSTPDATLHVRGVIAPPVIFAPSAPDFGRVPAGESRTLPVVVTYDPALAAPGQTVALACSDPRLRLTHDDAPPTAPHTLRYRLTLPAGLATGKISATLSLVLTPGDGATSSPWLALVRGEIAAPPAGH